jgi:hypothetical protein
MNAHLWPKRCRLRVVALSLLVLSIGLSAAGAAEPAFGPKKAADAEKLNRLAKDLDKHGINVPQWLRTTLGFSPELDGFPVDAHVYFDLPDVVKLQAAYQARENTKANSGVVLLDLLSKRLALEQLNKKTGDLKEADLAAKTKLAEEFVQLFKELTPDFKLDNPQTQLVKFTFKPAPERPQLPEADRQRLVVLAQFLEQSRNGGPSDALKHYFALDAGAAYALLWESGTLQRAFERALVQKQEQEPKFLDSLIQRVNEDALKRKERTLERTAILWSKAPHKAPGDDELPAVAPPGPKFPDVPAPLRTAEKRAEEYRKDNEKGGSLKPADVRKRLSSPSGIYLAGEVRADKALPKPTGIEYIPGSNVANGKLTFTFADSSKRTLAPVHAEDAWIAYEMVYGASAAKSGDGIPLLSLDGTLSYFEVKDGKLIQAGRREITVHPALLDRELGQACVRLDGLPSTHQWLLDEISAAPVWDHFDKEQAARRRQTLQRTADWVFDPWTNLDRKYGPYSSVVRMVDVPLVLHDHDGTLLVERADPAGLWSEPLRRQTFLEVDLVVQKYSKLGRLAGEVQRPEPYRAETYKLIAELLPLSAELQRLNNFAAVLAVVRWAKAADASFTAPAKPKEGSRTPEAVAVFPEKMIALPGHSSKEVLKQETAKLDAELKKLGETEAIKKFQSVCGKLLKAEDKDAVEKLAKQLVEVSQGSAEARLFEELVEAKYAQLLTADREPLGNKKPDLDAENKRLRPLVKKLAELQEESPGEFLMGRNIILRYLKRLQEQTDID